MKEHHQTNMFYSEHRQYRIYTTKVYIIILDIDSVTPSIPAKHIQTKLTDKRGKKLQLNVRGRGIYKWDYHCLLELPFYRDASDQQLKKKEGNVVNQQRNAIAVAD